MDGIDVPDPPGLDAIDVDRLLHFLCDDTGVGVTTGGELFVNLNDTFGFACADAERLTTAEAVALQAELEEQGYANDWETPAGPPYHRSAAGWWVIAWAMQERGRGIPVPVVRHDWSKWRHLRETLRRRHNATRRRHYFPRRTWRPVIVNITAHLDAFGRELSRARGIQPRRRDQVDATWRAYIPTRKGTT